MTRDPMARAPHAARLPADTPPQLLVFIDTEEEFDWQKNFTSDARGVTAMKHQWRAQTIFDRYGVKPVYLVDYPVASQPSGYTPLREFFDDGRCEIGAHLHPWVTPPVEETVSDGNSFACNLPRDLERRKLSILKETIERNLGAAPTVYRAGRYGADAETRGLLEELGFLIDSSVLPWTDLRHMAGPDFRHFAPDPFWFGANDRLLEIPLTTGFLGLLYRFGEELFPWIGSPRGVRLRATAICARARLLDRIRLSPEGVTIDEAVRLTRALVRRGEQRVFVVSYHSPSLGVGHTPYVRTRADLEQFLAWLDAYLEFFMGEIGGRPASTGDIYRAMAAADGRAPLQTAQPPGERRRAAG